MLMLDKQEFIASIEVALRDVLGEQIAGLEDATADQIAKSLRGEIRSLLRSRGRRVRGRSKESFLQDLRQKHGQLSKDNREASQEIDSLERRLERVKQEGLQVEPSAEDTRAMMERVRAELVECGLAKSAPVDLRRAILAFGLDAVTAERKRALAEGARSREVEIERLQRRLAKLNTTVEDLQDAARELERQLAQREAEEADEAAALLRPRLDLGERTVDEKKRAFMEDIFLANLDLRDQLG